MLKTIVVPLDDSEGARRILPFVAALASPERTAVTLVYVIADAGLRDHATAVLDRAREQLAGGVQVQCLVYEGATAPTIIQTAQALRADLIAMTTDHETGLDRWLNGSVADEVLRGAGVPVLIVPSNSHAQWTRPKLRVLVPLDGSNLAEAALDPALAIARRVHGDVQLLRVTSDHEPADTALEYLCGVASEAAKTVERPSVLVMAGEPAREIAEVAWLERIDLIVMATHGRTGLARLALGSIATGTLQTAGVPVLLVPPPRLGRQAEAAVDDEALILPPVPAWLGG